MNNNIQVEKIGPLSEEDYYRILNESTKNEIDFNSSFYKINQIFEFFLQNKDMIEYRVNGENITYLLSIDDFKNLHNQRPNDIITFDNVILSYGSNSPKSLELEELKLLHQFFFGVIDSFNSFLKKENRKSIFNVGYQYWIYLGKKDKPYNSRYLLTNELFEDWLNKSKDNPKYFPGASISPSKEWNENKEPIMFLLTILELIYNIKLDISITLTTVSKDDQTPRVFNDGNYSWNTYLTIIN